MIDKLRYPIGQFNMAEEVSVDQINFFISQIEALPQSLADSLYAWHGNHHLAHILNFRKSLGLCK